MNNTSTLLLVLLGSPLVMLSLSQNTTSGSTENYRTDSETPTLQSLVVSSDGSWIAAEKRMDLGATNVHVWSTNRDKTFTIENGHNPRISHDSRWVSVLLHPSATKKQGNVTKGLDGLGQTLVLLNLKDGSRKTFKNVLSYELTYYSSHLVYLQSSMARKGQDNSQNGKPTQRCISEIRNKGTLHVAELSSDREFTWNNVTEFAAHQEVSDGVPGTWKEGYAFIAFVTHNDKSDRDCLEIAFVGHSKAAWGTGGRYKGGRIQELCWSGASVKLSFVDSSIDNPQDANATVGTKIHVWHNNRGQTGYREFTTLDTN